MSQIFLSSCKERKFLERNGMMRLIKKLGSGVRHGKWPISEPRVGLQMQREKRGGGLGLLMHDPSLLVLFPSVGTLFSGKD
jgi:hypothetical protein